MMALESTVQSPGWISLRVSLTTTVGSEVVLSRVKTNDSLLDAKRSVVILAHGTFSNHRSCSRLARYLAGLGHDCWLLDFEGHGLSAARQSATDFESLFLTGSDAVLNYFAKNRGQKIHWVGHSGGGLAALMALSRHPEKVTGLHSLVMLGSQACEAGKPVSRRIILALFVILTRMLGRVPGKALRLGPEDEAASVMLQWFRWNLAARWLGADDFDYMQALAQTDALCDLPVLSMGGAGDWFIAPPKACQHLHALLPGDGNVWQECGLIQGFEEDYSHSRLISSRAAAREIWPRVADWLARVDQGENR